jgi:hypothetical protein
MKPPLQADGGMRRATNFDGAALFVISVNSFYHFP